MLDWASRNDVAADSVRRRLLGGRRRRARRRPTAMPAWYHRPARLDKVLEVDKTSRAAPHPGRRAGPGARGAADAARAHAAPLPAELRVFDARRLDRDALGRALRDALHPYRRLRGKPAHGHAAAARSESRRLPGSGAGPSPDRLMIGSEGTLGIITEAWMRLQDRPTLPRRHVGARSRDFYTAAERRARDRAGRALSRRTCACSIPTRRSTPAPATARVDVMVLAFESADHDVGPWMARALECCARSWRRAGHGQLEAPDRRTARARRAPGATPSSACPTPRDHRRRWACINDTFETAITWDRFEEFHAAIMAATERRVEARPARGLHVTCRFTHVYPDGPAPYFSFHGRGRKGQHGRAMLGDQARRRPTR